MRSQFPPQPDRHRPGPTLAATVRPLPKWVWTAIAGCGLLLTMLSVAVEHRFTVGLRLTVNRHVPAVAVLLGMAAGMLGAALMGRRQERFGLMGLTGVSLGASLCWLLLSAHRLDGPVVFHVSEAHGVHIGDLVAVLPATVAVALTWRLLVLARGPRCSQTPSIARLDNRRPPRPANDPIR
jgi:hypothetical protein